ncbi:hypothetical protein M011DRAFT_470132 [Sporormia fimetaria CBS 119925]|uniref:Uncharacterized protein n=1 Tax=Sporormia fimetaria CBS 119925 TaxID=1340428 RepID=A0A6A6V4K2_9PLEO|nr:hypothetical protein M011DRAFT_470132 [Sporormia fimetaria CBS 119925]
MWVDWTLCVGLVPSDTAGRGGGVSAGMQGAAACTSRGLFGFRSATGDATSNFYR